MAKQQITLSPEALAALRLPLEAGTDKDGHCIRDAHGLRIARNIGTIRTTDDVDGELAAFIAALVNAALTPDQENFFDAVRNDPDMKPEHKSKWLALEPPVSQ